MSKLIGIRIDVSKITKDRLYHGEKGVYLKLTASLDNKPDEYGNHLSVWEEQTQEERKGKKNKNYLGSGKVFWEGETTRPQTAEATPEEDDLPF